MLRDELVGVNGAAGHPHASASAAGPLTRCVGVGVDEFAEELWGRRPLFTPARDRAAFDDLFSPEAVDELVSRRGLRTPFLRMAKNGSVLPERSFTGSGGSGASIADQASDDRILAQLADGATLVLQALHRTWPPLVAFGSALAAQLGHPVQINSYVTPAENQGFAPHYDTHDVFVLQIAGRKRWMIHEPVIEHPLADQPWDHRKAAVAERAAQPALIDQILEPGDALYLPRGFLHAATALGELSIHLTVGIHPITRYRLAESLVRALRDDPELRRSLPVGVDLSDPVVLAEHLRAVADRLAASVDRTDQQLPAVAAALAAELTAATRPAPVGPLAQLSLALALEPQTPVQVRPGLRRSIRSATAAGSSVALTALEKTISFPAVMDSALHLLLDGQPHLPVDLPGLDPDEQLVLVRRLLREGIVVPAETGSGRA